MPGWQSLRPASCRLQAHFAIFSIRASTRDSAAATAPCWSFCISDVRSRNLSVANSDWSCGEGGVPFGQSNMVTLPTCGQSTATSPVSSYAVIACRSCWSRSWPMLLREGELSICARAPARETPGEVAQCCNMAETFVSPGLLGLQEHVCCSREGMRGLFIPRGAEPHLQG